MKTAPNQSAAVLKGLMAVGAEICRLTAALGMAVGTNWWQMWIPLLQAADPEVGGLPILVPLNFMVVQCSPS